MMYLKLVSILVLGLSLISCGSKSAIPPPEPTPLVEFKESVGFNKNWLYKVSNLDKKSKVFSALLPTVHRDQIIVASPDGHLASLEKSNGDVRWHVSFDEQISAGVGGDGYVAVVVSGDGKVIGLNGETGEQLWENDSNRTIFAQPLVYRGVAVIRTIDGDLIGLASDSGEKLWDTIYEQPDFVVFGSPQPIGHENLTIIGNATGRIIATHLSSGLETWQIYLASQRSLEDLQEADSIPVVSRGQLIVSDFTNAVVAYSLAQGVLMWENRRPAGRRLALADSIVYGVDTDSRVFAMSRADGAVLWEQDELLHRGGSNIALVEGFVVVDDALGFLHVFDQRTGKMVGRTKIKSKVLFGGLLVDNSNLFVSLDSGNIEAYTLHQLTSSN